MPSYPPRGLFITGTNTEVGKTYIGAMIARALVASGRTVATYKPVASGCRRVEGQLIADDAVQLWEGSDRHGTLEEVCPQRFAAPVAPHRAAAAENKRVDDELIRSGLAAWTGRCEIVIVEAAGGLMSPMTDDHYAVELAFEFGYPLVIVAANELGVINQTLQTLIAAAHYDESLRVAGIVLNDAQPASSTDQSRGSNYEELQQRCGEAMLAHVPHGAEQFPADIDWWSLASQRIRWPWTFA